MKIEVLGEEIYGGAIATEAGAFKKWLKVKHPDIELVIPQGKDKVDLHDFTLVMPLVQLAAEQSIVNYLNLVLEYANYYFSGSLKGEKNKVSLRAKYFNSKSGELKEFCFEGSEESLGKTIKQFDINRFLES